MSLQSFNTYALLTVVKLPTEQGVIRSTVLMGLITTGILKFLSSVVKSFTSSASLVMTSILSSLLLGVELKYPAAMSTDPSPYCCILPRRYKPLDLHVPLQDLPRTASKEGIAGGD